MGRSTRGSIRKLEVHIPLWIRWLPPGGAIRARGHVTGGYNDSSGWFVETILGSPLTVPVLKIQRVAGDIFSLSLQGPPGQTYTLQTAGSLEVGVTWTPITTFTLTNSSRSVFWTNQSDAARFFRAKKD